MFGIFSSLFEIFSRRIRRFWYRSSEFRDIVRPIIFQTVVSASHRQKGIIHYSYFDCIPNLQRTQKAMQTTTYGKRCGGCGSQRTAYGRDERGISDWIGSKFGMRMLRTPTPRPKKKYSFFFGGSNSRKFANFHQIAIGFDDIYESLTNSVKF